MLARHNFDFCNFVVSFTMGKQKFSNFVLFFSQDFLLSIQAPLRFHMNFRMGFSISSKNDIGILVGIALNLPIVLDTIVILTILSFNPRAEDFCIYLGL